MTRRRIINLSNWLKFCLLFVLVLPAYSIIAESSFNEHRVQVGLKLFRTLINADLDIVNKADSKNQINLVLIASQENPRAIAYKEKLQQTISSVNNLEVNIHSLSAHDFIHSSSFPVAAIFISETLSREQLKALTRITQAKNIITFSPFEGDVESGILAGLSVQATVRPLINSNTLAKSKLHIKPFYLKVAKLYE